MRFLTTVVVSCLAIFLFPNVGAIHHRGKSPAKRVDHNVSPAHSSILAKRQHHVRRDLIDICVSLDATVLSTLLHIVDPLLADVHLCLCLQDLDIFLDTDVDALLIASIIGKEKLRALLKVILDTSPRAQHCTLPPHAHRACVVGNPCAFICEPNYIKVGNTCVCPRPLSECNGRCGNFPHGCPSATPHYPRSRNLVLGPITTLAQARASCKAKETVCGIAGREDTIEYECVDTESTLDSCGGCMVPHPFTDTSHLAARGKDCGHLPGVVAAQCSNSQCIISQCQNGWTVNYNRTECIGAPLKESRNSRMRKERRRNDVLDANANVVVDSALRAQLKTLVILVVDLIADSTSFSNPVPKPSPSSPPSPNYVDLVNAIAYVTANILSSPTVSSLIKSIDDIVHLTTLLDTELSKCGCIGSLGLQPLVDDLLKVTESALGVQSWCRTHPVGIPTHSSGPRPDPGSPPPLNNSNDAIIIGLDDLLDELGLSSVKIDLLIDSLRPGLHQLVNELLTGLGIGPPNVRSRRDGLDVTALVDTKLVDQIKVIVHLCLTLKDDSAVLPTPPGTPAIPGTDPTILPIDRSLVDAILHAVANLLVSAHVATLRDNIDALVNTNTLVASTLGGCRCADSLGLGTVVTDVENILNAALGLQRWCSEHPALVPSPRTPPGSSPAPSGPSAPGHSPPTDLSSILEIPIDLGLGNLLASLGVNLDTNVALQGLVKALVTLVVKLQDDSNMLPAPSVPSPAPSPLPPHGTPIPLDKDLVDAIVKLTGNLLLSQTSDDLLAYVEALLNLSADLGGALNGCGCVGVLGLEGLVKDVQGIVDRLLAIKRWCGEPAHLGHGSGHGPTSEHIIIDAERLLSSLGLDGLLKVGGVVDLGGGLSSLNKPANSLLKSLGLGGLRRWLGL